MIEEFAVVTDLKDNQATLEIERRTACGLCGKTRGCGNATWGKLLGHNSHAFTAENPVNANVGDSVVVGINEQAVLYSAFFLYVVPLFGLLVGTMLADYFFNNQMFVILGAILGVVLGFLWVKGHLVGCDKSGVAYSKKYQTVILRLTDNKAGLVTSGLDNNRAAPSVDSADVEIN
jgi:sigma-E factor negative regulatory protein RseC